MASIGFDPTTGWWNIRYLAGPGKRVKKPLCKHPSPWTQARPPKRPPDSVIALAVPYQEAERRAKLGMETLAPTRTDIRAYFAGYIDRVALSLRPKTIRGIRVACNKFAAYCDGRSIKTIQSVNYAVCRDWIAHRLAEKAKRSTVVTERASLRPIWTQAAMERIVVENPWAGARIPGKRRAEVPTAWTRDECSSLTRCLDGWLKDLVQVGLNTGIRIAALLALKWAQVDWPAGLIRVRAATSKSGRPYDVPITPTCHDVLFARHATHKHDTLVFQNPATGKAYASQTTYIRIGRAVKRAKIPDYGDYNHVLRRTFATLALNSGVPLEVVSRCLDHATLAQTQRGYAHILNSRLKEGMAGFNLGPES